VTLQDDARVAYEAALAAAAAQEQARKAATVKAAKEHLGVVLAAADGTPRSMTGVKATHYEDTKRGQLVVLTIDGLHLAVSREREGGAVVVRLVELVDGAWTSQGPVGSLADLGRLLAERVA